MGTLYKEIHESLHEELQKYASRAVKANPHLVKDYFEGHSALGALVGHAMKDARGSVNPAFVGEFIVVELEKLRRTDELNNIMRGNIKRPRRVSNERDDEPGFGGGKGHAGPGHSLGQPSGVCSPDGLLEAIRDESREGHRSGDQPDSHVTSDGSQREEPVGLEDEDPSGRDGAPEHV